MDTQNLKAFVAVAQERSFSAAAEKLHLTQPAVSKRIFLLERELEVSLFDRVGRQISLTETGRTLLIHSREILDSIQIAKQAVRDMSGGVRGTLNLVTSHHIGLHRLPAVLRQYNQLYPDVELDIGFLDSGEAYQAISKGQYDIGVLTEVTHGTDSIHREAIWHDKLNFVAAPQHPLSRAASVSLEDISQYPALLPEQKFTTTAIVEELFHKNGLEINIKLTTNYLETIKALISVGYAWGVLPESMLQDKTLTVINPAHLELSRQLDCIYHKERSLSRAAQAFVELLNKFKDPCEVHTATTTG